VLSWWNQPKVGGMSKGDKMSVSFSPAFVEGVDVPSVIVCGCRSFRSEEFPSREVAVLAMPAVTLVCSDPYCDDFKLIDPVTSEPEVNVSNATAVELLDNLGILVGEDFSERCLGSISATDLKGRVLMALALLPEDEGMPAHQAGNTMFGLQVWTAPRPAGHTQNVLHRLLEVAEFALAQGREVDWG
jgi:hypothetical protein